MFSVNGQNGKYGATQILILTFEDGQFILGAYAAPTNEWSSYINNKTALSIVATRPGFQLYKTKNMEAAARLRSFADSKTEKIFKKFMLQSYAIPSCGPLSPIGETLLPFQKEQGVPHILGLNKSFVAHQPGLGKTAQGICAVNTKPGRTLIVVPSFLKTTWAREITKWFIKDFPTIAIVPESNRQFEADWHADFIICSDAMIIKEWVRTFLLKQKFRFMFIDEVHRFKEPTSLRTVALFGGTYGKFKSPGLIYNSEHVSALSGTPMLNKAIELWPVLYAMAPETIDFMTYHDFGFKYGRAVQDNFGRWIFSGSSNEEELNKRITKKFMQIIKKKDVLKDLPEKIREVILIDTDTRSKEVLDLDHKLVRDLNLKNNLSSVDRGENAKLRHVTGLSKVPWVSYFVTSILATDFSEQIILFAWHRDVVEELAKALAVFKPMVINGGVEDEVRTKYQDLFQSGERRLIIGNISAMNLGITLTAATRVVFAEYSWTPAENEQAEDRANRIGSKWSVFCQYLVLPNSFDYTILNSNLEKEKSIGKVIQ